MTSDLDTPHSLFEAILALPSTELLKQAQYLIGFSGRRDRLAPLVNLLLDKAGVDAWSERFYKTRLPIVDLLGDRYPLLVFEGDVGTGKTATAEAFADDRARSLDREGMLFKLSTRVRGTGQVGQISALIAQAFDIVVREAGRARLAFLIIDEADSLASHRGADQSHHEDKVAVNTLIQRLDDLRRLNGRVLVILCTNRYAQLDPAILRRAAAIEHFGRPTVQEREELLRRECDGLNLSEVVIRELVALTGPDTALQSVGFTFSDLRTRLLPEALARAYPKRKVEAQDLLETARALDPSPSMDGHSVNREA